jgi:hypothetical protein
LRDPVSVVERPRIAAPKTDRCDEGIASEPDAQGMDAGRSAVDPAVARSSAPSSGCGETRHLREPDGKGVAIDDGATRKV